MALPDLVQAKKTQRDKDWPMLRRLVEAHYFEHRSRATPAQVNFWLGELRTPELLIEAAGRWPAASAAEEGCRFYRNGLTARTDPYSRSCWKSSDHSSGSP